MQEFVGIRHGERNGSATAVSVCSYGRKGSGSRTAVEAEAGWACSRAGPQKQEATLHDTDLRAHSTGSKTSRGVIAS
jgi:hypothetical protein